MVTHSIFRCKFITYFLYYLIIKNKTTEEFAFATKILLLRSRYEIWALHLTAIILYAWAYSLHGSRHP